MDDAGMMFGFFWVLLLGGLALAWIVRSLRWRRALKGQIAQLTARVYSLEQSLKTVSEALAERTERPTEPAKQPLIPARQAAALGSMPVQDAKSTAVQRPPSETFPAPPPPT